MKRETHSQIPDELSYAVSYDEPGSCPLCHFAIKPDYIEGEWYRDDKSHRHLAIFYTCPHCFRPFVAHFTDDSPMNNCMSPVLDYCGPELYSAQQFEANIAGLSPQFVKVYNQALEAESRQLDEIAGIGYRKALEFLVKDYCKHTHPEKGTEIERLPLGKCISDYIENRSITTLASRAVWIGNDETHYTRKHEDRDIADMKSFIQAMVHYIGMELVVEDAASMEPAH